MRQAFQRSPRPAWSWSLLAAGLLFACNASTPPDNEAAVAILSSGELRIEDVEATLRDRISTEAEESTTGDWPAVYRRATEALALERILLEDIRGTANFSAAASEELGTEALRLTCDVMLDLYFTENPLPEPNPSEDEIEELYDTHPQFFDRQEQRLAWHLFQRHRDPERPEETITRLQELRRRALAGEAFRRLAEAHSESENRKLGGHLGWMVRRKLPPDLEQVVFSLELGAISEPLLTDSGAFLVHVSDIIPGGSISREEARSASVLRLREQHLLQQLQQMTADLEPAEGDEILDEQDLRSRLQLQGPGAVVLRIGDTELRGQDLLDLLDSRPNKGLELASVETRLDETYRLQVYRQLLCRKIRAEGFLETAERRQWVDRRQQQLGATRLVEHRLEELIHQQIERDPQTLRGFYDDNRHLFQSSLRLRVEGLAIPPGEDPEADQARLEVVREELVAGKIPLAVAIERLDARVVAPHWIDPTGLLALEPKIRVYLTQVSGTGYTVPFQQNGLLQLLHISERQDPAPLPFDQVKESVRKEYYRRHQQDLFATVRREQLEAAGFEYRPEVVARHLATLGIDSRAEGLQ